MTQNDKIKELEESVEKAVRELKAVTARIEKALGDSMRTSREIQAADFLNRKSKWVIDAKEEQKKWHE